MRQFLGKLFWGNFFEYNLQKKVWSLDMSGAKIILLSEILKYLILILVWMKLYVLKKKF